MNRPCLDCGALVGSGSRCADCRPKNLRYVRGKRGRTGSDWRWRKLSQKLRRLSPFCEVIGCGSTDLTVDHIIPIEDPQGAELIYEPLNCRVICRSHNGARGDRCTPEERRQVLDAIERKHHLSP